MNVTKNLHQLFISNYTKSNLPEALNAVTSAIMKHCFEAPLAFMPNDRYFLNSAVLADTIWYSLHVCLPEELSKLIPRGYLRSKLNQTLVFTLERMGYQFYV